MRDIVTVPIILTGEEHAKVKEKANEKELTLKAFIRKRLLEDEK